MCSMPISKSFKRGDTVIPTLNGGVVADDNSSPNARSGTGELTVHDVSGRGDGMTLTLRGIDGELHRYSALYFTKNILTC